MSFAPVFSTHMLPTFLNCVKGYRKPTILDIGAVTGQNIQFLLGKGTKVYVDDVLTGWEEWKELGFSGHGTPAQMEEYLEKHLAYPPGFFDGILCWDTLDAIDPLSSRQLIGRLYEILKHRGTILALFGQGARVSRVRAKYCIVDEGHIEYGWTPAGSPSDHQYENQQIHAMFGGFSLIRIYLLRNGIREILFRKESSSAHQPVPNSHPLQRQGTLPRTPSADRRRPWLAMKVP